MSEDAEYPSLTDAMLANDELAEAIKRYRMVDEAFREAGAREKKSLSVELANLMRRIVYLRANKPADSSPAEPTADPRFGKIVPIDDRFRDLAKRSS